MIKVLEIFIYLINSDIIRILRMIENQMHF